MIKRFQNLNNWHIFYILTAIAVISLAGSARAHFNAGDIAWWSWWDGALQNFSTEMLGAIATFALIELIVGSRDEKQSLIIDMARSDNTTAKNAVSKLMAKGWLIDGSLQGADLFRANLEGANLVRANLEGANLVRANLEDAKLRSVILERASLLGANLERAHLEFTNLERAYLEDANLEDAKLSRANLKGAFLLKANLERAYLDDANLEGANLHSANLEGANLVNANLKHCNMFYVKCNEETILPDRQKWTSDVDWSTYGAVELDGSKWLTYGR